MSGDGLRSIEDSQERDASDGDDGGSFGRISGSSRAVAIAAPTFGTERGDDYRGQRARATGGVAFVSMQFGTQPASPAGVSEDKSRRAAPPRR